MLMTKSQLKRTVMFPQVTKAGVSAGQPTLEHVKHTKLLTVYFHWGFQHRGRTFETLQMEVSTQ